MSEAQMLVQGSECSDGVILLDLNSRSGLAGIGSTGGKSLLLQLVVEELFGAVNAEKHP